MRYAFLAFHILLDLMISSGISIASVVSGLIIYLVRKYSETMVGLEILVGLKWQIQTFR